MLLLMCAAAAVLMITMGMRQSLGLYIAPIIESTHVGYAAMSFALAVGQLMWGVAQPVFGALADRHGSRPVLIAGALLLAAGTALTPFASNEFVLLATLGVLTAAGAGAGSFSVLIGVVAQRVPAAKRSVAVGFRERGRQPRPVRVRAAQSIADRELRLDGRHVDHGGGGAGHHSHCRPAAHEARPSARRPAHGQRRPRSRCASSCAIAARDRSYWCLHAGLLHLRIPHLVSRHPSAGRSEAVQPAGVRGRRLARHHRPRQRRGQSHRGLGRRRDAHEVAAVRHVLQPRGGGGRLPGRAQDARSPSTCSPRCSGFTWLATVPPTAGLIGKLFGVRYLATLFGLATFTHQIGGFFGAWLGGRALTAFGDFSWMWYADIALALAAAFINLPIREAKLKLARRCLPNLWIKPSIGRATALSGKTLVSSAAAGTPR